MNMARPSAFDEWAATFAGLAWRDVRRRREVLPALGEDVLLHAGPPYAGLPPTPVQQAAIQAILFEGWVDTADAAQHLIHTGKVRLAPAQDHGVVTPLAQVVSASMPLAVVGDGQVQAYAPLVEGPAPALRFGTTDASALARLHSISAMGLHELSAVLQAQPLPLAPVIQAGLAQGDECHGRTAAANAALLQNLHGISPAALTHNPGFVLTILMAAAAARLARDDAPLKAAGGNGLDFGIKLPGAATWRTTPATPPIGSRFAGHAETAALGAIGDSAVLDFCGLGGQALTAAPALTTEWQAFLPEHVGLLRQLTTNRQGLVDPATVRASGVPPVVNLAILDASGQAELIGRGFYTPDLALFDA